jgi:uracil-DNA glycosylase
MEQLPSLIHTSWHPFLEPLFQTPEIKFIKDTVLPKCIYYPQRKDIFRVFSMPIEEIKVVILGQDPYPNPNQATGYAFAVNDNINKPASLRNIEKEVGHSLDRTLQNWVEQGVFLLNTALTVEKNRAGSHSSFWLKFTQSVIQIISAEVNPIWFLWGLHAKSYEGLIRLKKPDKDYSNILTAPHPASESYSGGKAGFFGCKHFEKANELLSLNNQSIINW